MSKTVLRPTSCALLLAALLLALGCSTAHYREDADREVYAIISSKAGAVSGMPKDFSVEPPREEPLAGVGRADEASIRPEEREAPAGDAAPPPFEIDLLKALETASASSRDYQDQRESVYLAALDLTLQRNRFRPQFSGNVTGEFEHDEDDEETVSGDSSFGFDWLLATGGTISAELATSLSEYLTGNPRKAATSLLSFTFAQFQFSHQFSMLTCCFD